MNSLPVADLPLLVLAWIQSPDYIEMTDRQKVVFSIICDEPGPHHVRDLARKVPGVDKSVISRICAKLDDAGLITHKPSGRDCTLQATKRGYEIRAGMRALSVQ